MSFCAIFIALLLERFFDCSHLRQWRWFPRFQKIVTQKMFGQSSNVLFAALLAPFMIGVLCVYIFFNDALFGFIKLFLSIPIILYCFGPRNLWADIFGCLINIENNDAVALREALKVSFGVVPANGPQLMHKELMNNIFIQANRRVFAIVIWFGILGLFGVVLYRVLSLLIGQAGDENVDQPIANLARRIEGYMDWVSVRVFSFLFALGGHFSQVFNAWRSYVGRNVESNDAMLVDCGVAALSLDANKDLPTNGSIEKEQIGLLDRSFAIMLVILALLVFWIP